MPGRRSRTWPCCACGRKSWLSAIYSASGARFASYTQGASEAAYPVRPGAPGYTIDKGELAVFHPIVDNGEVLGTVYLRARFDLIGRLVNYSLSILGGVLLGSLVIAALVASRLQKSITEPLGAVATVARAVMQQRDFQLAGAAQSWRDRGTGGGLQ
ncbi:hypothetical protein LP419_02370 [Massilia sp. H-1]|nr:hypothetical protein LP419_02370 [Massilia sp. H-1]